MKKLNLVNLLKEGDVVDFSKRRSKKLYSDIRSQNKGGQVGARGAVMHLLSQEIRELKMYISKPHFLVQINWEGELGAELEPKQEKISRALAIIQNIEQILQHLSAEEDL